MPTKIEWAQEAWNPVTGCTPISEGCKNCYAKRMSKRLAGRFGYPADKPFKVTLHHDKLVLPLGWKKPRRVFVCSMGDLFHEDVPFEYIAEIEDVMSSTVRHTYMLLTKRPDRMLAFTEWMIREGDGMPGAFTGWAGNVYLGVTVENQEQADKRIPVLLQIPAAVRFVSVEPMLGLTRVLGFGSPLWGKLPPAAYLHWVIAGCETGPGARPMNIGWVRDLRNRCLIAQVPFFFKRDSDGNRCLDGVMWEQYPE